MLIGFAFSLAVSAAVAGTTINELKERGTTWFFWVGVAMLVLCFGVTVFCFVGNAATIQ